MGGQAAAEGAAAVASAVSVAAAAASYRWAGRTVSRSEAGVEAVRGWLDPLSWEGLGPQQTTPQGD